MNEEELIQFLKDNLTIEGSFEKADNCILSKISILIKDEVISESQEMIELNE